VKLGQEELKVQKIEWLLLVAGLPVDKQQPHPPFSNS
jgi:hypothetical protein